MTPIQEMELQEELVQLFKKYTAQDVQYLPFGQAFEEQVESAKDFIKWVNDGY